MKKLKCGGNLEIELHGRIRRVGGNFTHYSHVLPRHSQIGRESLFCKRNLKKAKKKPCGAGLKV
jgi:hypothetical protein